MTIRLTDKQLSEIRKARNLCRSIAHMIPSAKKEQGLYGEYALIPIDVDAIDNLTETADVLQEIVDMAEHVPDLSMLKCRVNELGEYAEEES